MLLPPRLMLASGAELLPPAMLILPRLMANSPHDMLIAPDFHDAAPPCRYAALLPLP